MDRNVLLALAAAQQAADDAALVSRRPDARRRALRHRHRRLPHDDGAARDPARPRLGAGRARGSCRNACRTSRAARSPILLGLRGHNLAPISACSTGAHAVMEAAELIRRGDADVVLAGGGEACIHPLIIAGFTTMKGLGAPRPGEGPETASRPFDATRDGFVCSEGATVLVIESVEHAERRGARIHAEVVSGGNTNDAYHAVTPRPDSLGVVTMMRIALAKAGIDPSEIGYINPHGTSTPQGDAAETKAIKEVFGDHAQQARASRRRSRPPATSSAAPARSRSPSARSRCATRSCRPRSTTAIPTPSATSTTCPRARARSSWSTRSRTRWASAATTAASSCAATAADAQARIWPAPRTTYFVVVMSARPTGPRACRRAVELPISAPKPNSPPSVKRVDALT